MIGKIAPDKWKHFFAGIGLGAMLQAIFIYIMPTYLTITVWISFLLVLLISYGVELTSKLTKRGHYDLWDALASVLGGIIGIGLILLFVMNTYKIV